MRRILCIVALICAIAPTLAAQTAAQKSKKAKLEREIAILDKQLKENSAKTGNALTSLKLTRKKISSRKQLVAESDAEIKRLDAEIEAKSGRIDDLQVHLDTLTVYYRKLVHTAYRNRDARIWYMYILASGNFGQAMRRFGYLKSISAQMNAQARKVRDTKAAVTREKSEKEALRTRAEGLREKRLQELESLKKDEAEGDRLVQQLRNDKAKYQKQIAGKRREMENLRKQMEKMVQSSAGKPKTAVDAKLDAEFAANCGKLPWPVDGPVVDSFGEHYHPVYTNVKMPFNNGINIAVAKNTAAKAVFNGTVKNIMVMAGYNQCVLVQHGGYFTFYCKLASVNVKAGDKVKTGDVIGRVDTISGETQLHFELWEGRNPRDPEIWLK